MGLADESRAPSVTKMTKEEILLQHQQKRHMIREEKRTSNPISVEARTKASQSSSRKPPSKKMNETPDGFKFQQDSTPRKSNKQSRVASAASKAAGSNRPPSKGVTKFHNPDPEQLGSNFSPPEQQKLAKMVKQVSYGSLKKASSGKKAPPTPSYRQTSPARDTVEMNNLHVYFDMQHGPKMTGSEGQSAPTFMIASEPP